MRYLNVLLKVVVLIFTMIAVFLIGVLLIDAWNTRYLDAEGASNSHLITNVNVIPMTKDTILKDHMVWIENGVVKAVSRKIETLDVEIIDGRGGYLLPGLIDMHVHIWDKYELGLYLSNGVTAVRNLWGLPMHLRMKADIERGNLIAPSFYTTGPKLTGREFMGDDNLNLYSPDEAIEKVRSYKERGYDFIKTYYGLDEDIFDAMIEEARNSGMEIAAHPSQKVSYAYHLNPQIKSVEHAEEIVQQALRFDLDTAKLDSVVSAVATTDHFRLCPTITGFHNIYKYMTNKDVLEEKMTFHMNPLIKRTDSESQFNRWNNANKEDPSTAERIQQQHLFHLLILKKLHDAGVTIVCGSDAGIGITLPGFSIHEELQFYTEAGLSNYEAIKTATSNAASTHEIMSHLGTVEPGKTANLILVDENPLQEIAALQKPLRVLVEGRPIERETLYLFEDKALRRSNLIASAIRYVEFLLVEK